MKQQSIKDVQKKILETMLYIDDICRSNGITYYIMGGTALGAVRHKGFIPWDDDLDIFMTPENYNRFKSVFNLEKNKSFVLQEWKVVDEYVEYAKVRMDGTTFIEEAFKDRKDMHHGIYVDIMILHKCPLSVLKQKLIYVQSKFVTLYALSQRNWKPKSKFQSFILGLLKIMPKRAFAKLCYRNIYRYDKLSTNYKWCYFITPAKFHQGIFEASMFQKPVDILFEGKKLFGPTEIKKYLTLRYGNYMVVPPKEQQEEAVHAMIYDTENTYDNYIYKVKKYG